MFDERRQLPKGGRYCAYLRKSRDEMRHDSYYGEDCLDKHRTMLTCTADMYGVTIVEWYEEVGSGESIAARKEIKRLIKDIENGKWDGCFVMAIDRLSRGSQQDQGFICNLLEYTGMFLVTPGGLFDPLHYMDYEMVSSMLYQSRGEYRNYNRRMRDSINASVLNGQYIAKAAPFGYDKDKLDNGFKTLKQNKDADTVRKMFRWSADDHLSLHEIAKRLTDEGIQTPTGKGHWHPTTISKILSNEVYMGVAKYGQNKVVKRFSTDVFERPTSRKKVDDYVRGEGKWDPIVDRDTFMRCKEQRAKHIPVPGGQENVKNILAGLLYCEKCGYAMTSLIDSGTHKRRFQHKSLKGCWAKGCNQDVVIAELVEAFKAEIENIDTEIERGETVLAYERAVQHVEALKAEVEKLDKRIANFAIMRADGDISKEEYTSLKADAESKRENVFKALAEAQSAVGAEPKLDELKINLHQAVEMLQDHNVDGVALNMFLKGFIKRIDYSNESEKGKNDKLCLTVHFL